MTKATSAIPEVEEKPQERILLVEDDIGLQTQMRWALSPFVVEVAGQRQDAVAKLGQGEAFRIVVLDLGLPPDANGASEGLRTLDEILSRQPNTKVIVASGNVDRANAVRAVGQGAFDFIAKPIDPEVLKLTIQRALRMAELEEENRALRASSRQSASGLVFASGKMAQVAQFIERVGPMDVNVLLTGETGTGKDVAARALHALSPRSGHPFVAINCASIPENLLESELFGHERGAFTGAIKRTQGKFELADKGTLFLDEIGDMPLALQAKLLRFLQDRKLERVGGREAISVNVRLICATNQKLENLIADQRFREDLYYRINDVKISLPALRERDDDIEILAHHFLSNFNRTFDKQVSGFTQDALKAMSTYPWPGNVRELENRIKRAVIMSDGKRIRAQDLDLISANGEPRSIDLKTEVEKLEKKLANEAMALCDGNVSKAAKLLGISRPHLYTLLGQA